MRFSVLHHPQGDRPTAAAGLLLLGVLALSFQDASIKLMSGDTSFWQLQTLRSISNMVLIVLLGWAAGNLVLIKPVNWKPVLLRASLLTVCMFFFFSGAPFLSPSQMGAGLYTYPLFISLLAGPVLGEHIGIWRISALVIGACGALSLLAPWHEEFSWVQVLPIVAGFFYAANVLTLRKACRGESPLALAFMVALCFSVSGLLGISLLSLFPLPADLQASMPFVATGWPQLSWLIAGFAVFVSVLNLTGNICLSRAYQTADASWLAPIDFSYLAFAVLWGFLMFGKWPAGNEWLGMTLIATAGIVTVLREHRVGRLAEPSQADKTA